MSIIQNRGFGRPVRDLSVNHLSADTICSKIISALEVTDRNLIDVESDIFDLQELVNANTEDIISNAEDITDLENTVADLSFIQALPWFNKPLIRYESLDSNSWIDESNTLNNQVPEPELVMFTRKLPLSRIYNSAIVVFPLTTNAVGESRSVSIQTKKLEASVYVTTNPNETTRLKSWDIEYIPSVQSPPDDIIGHAALMAKPSALNTFVFGSDRQQGISGNCMVFPNTGEWYVQALYLDNRSNVSSTLVVVGQKYGITTATPLGSVEIYGFQ